jgi:predicted Zn-dependent peptidase
VLAQESPGARMNRLGGSVLFCLPPPTPEEIAARIEAVWADDLQRLAREHLNLEHMYLSAIGPKELDLGKYLDGS